LKRLSQLFAIAITCSAMGFYSISTWSGETFYRWTDERGHTVHSDRPPPKGVKYEVISTQSTLIREVDADEGAVPLNVEPGAGTDLDRRCDLQNLPSGVAGQSGAFADALAGKRRLEIVAAPGGGTDGGTADDIQSGKADQGADMAIDVAGQPGTALGIGGVGGNGDGVMAELQFAERHGKATAGETDLTTVIITDELGAGRDQAAWIAQDGGLDEPRGLAVDGGVEDSSQAMPGG